MSGETNAAQGARTCSSGFRGAAARHPIPGEHRAQVQQDFARSLPALGSESGDSCTYWLWDLSRLHHHSGPQFPRLPEGTVTPGCEA